MLHAFGIIRYILAYTRANELYPVWIYMLLILPMVCKIVTGINLFLLRKTVIPLMILTTFIVVFIYFASPYLLEVNRNSFLHQLLSIPIGTILDWVILLVIIRYTIGLNRKGELK